MRIAVTATAISAIIAVSGCVTTKELTPIDNGWPASAEFSQLMTGQARFSSHDGGVRNVLVLVDHQTGVQYLVTATGTCPLLDVDGSPLRVMEAGS